MMGMISIKVDLDQVKLWREQEKIDPYRKPGLYEAITAPIQKACDIEL